MSVGSDALSDREDYLMRINYKKLYENRIKEIDTQIKICIQRKHWSKKKTLEAEKKQLEEKLVNYN